MRGRRWLARTDTPEPPGIEWAGELPRGEWLDRVRRARVYVNASRWEDYGLGPLEALSAGTPLVTVPTPGSFEALPLARELAPELVARDVSAASLAESIRAALGLGALALEAYRERALSLLAPYREDAVLEAVASVVLPALGVAPR